MTTSQAQADSISFSPDQVRALCGGTFPDYKGFDYAYHAKLWFLEDGVLQPYESPCEEDILPAPGIRVTVEMETDCGWW
jgi:hypothetical protein